MATKPESGASPLDQRGFRLLFEVNPLPLILFDPASLAIVSANAVAARHYGYTPDELATLSIGDLAPLEEKTQWLEALAGIGWEPQHLGAWRHRTKSGAVFGVEPTIHPLPPGGRPLRLAVICGVADKRGAEALQRLALKVFDHIAEGIAITDDNANIIAVNAGFTRITGYGADEVIGRNPRMLQSGRQSREFYSSMWRTIEEKGHWRGEVVNRRKSGEPYPELLSITVVRDADGKPANYIGVFADLSERLQQETQIRELNATLDQRVQERTAELRAALDELDAFSYSVAHDLRAPLRGLDGFSHLLLEGHAGQLNAEGREHLHRIRAASQRLAEIIDDLLELSRVTRAPIERVPVHLSGIAHEIAASLRAEDAERQVDFAIAPQLRAMGDPLLLRLLLENLLGNAWKYTSKRAGARIEFGKIDIEDGTVAYFVRDNGAGFDMRFVHKLFKPFQRLHNANEFPGTGIGLASVARVAGRHSGRVWAEGAVGEGATVYFTLSENGSARLERAGSGHS